jgi:1,4-dihydroxy-2-naphthoyl-CoA hydrolase
VRFLFQLEEADVAQGIIRQLAINSETRRRCALPEAIDRWLEASAIGTIGTL